MNSDKRMNWKWRQWFAWRPVRLQGGRWAWLRHVERQVFELYDRHHLILRKSTYRSAPP